MTEMHACYNPAQYMHRLEDGWLGRKFYLHDRAVAFVEFRSFGYALM